MSWTAVPAGGDQHFAAVFIKITHYQSACYHRALSAAPCSVIRIPDPAPNTTPQHTHTSDLNITAQTELMETSPITKTLLPNSNSFMLPNLPIILTSEKLKRNMGLVNPPRVGRRYRQFQKTSLDDLMGFKITS